MGWEVKGDLRGCKLQESGEWRATNTVKYCTQHADWAESWTLI